MVLDEADRLFELGFLEQLDRVMQHIADEDDVQTCLFSATLPEGVEQLARKVLQNPIRVVIGTRNAGASSIDQKLLFVVMRIYLCLPLTAQIEVRTHMMK